MEKVVDDHNLRDAFKLRHEVVGAQWNPESSHWIITVRRNGDDADVFEDWCDVFVNGSGQFPKIMTTAVKHRELTSNVHLGLLNAWKWPAIPGLQSFKGPLLHTAAWDRSVNLDGKRIALIGVGSSGVQVLPALQPNAEVRVQECQIKVNH